MKRHHVLMLIGGASMIAALFLPVGTAALTSLAGLALWIIGAIFNIE